MTANEALQKFEDAAFVSAGDAAGDASLWVALQAQSFAEFSRAWISITARSFPSIQQSALLENDTTGNGLQPVVHWRAHHAAADTARFSQRTANVLTTAVKEQAPTIEGDPNDPATVYACHPIVLGNVVRAVVLVEARADNAIASRRLLRHLQWSSGWIEAFLRRHQHDSVTTLTSNAQTLLNIVNATLSEQRLANAARALASLLADIFKCERVAVGRREAQRTALFAASQTAEVDRRVELSRAIEAAMDEAIDQHAIIVSPTVGPRSNFVSHCNTDLMRQFGDCTIATVPLVCRDVPFGAIVLVRTSTPFSPADIDLIDSIAATAAAVLTEKAQNDLTFVGLIGLRLRRMLESLLGPQFLAAKAAAVAALVALLTITFVHDTYRVTAHGQVHGEQRRAISAPFDGYVRAQYVRAGETARAGDLLAELQDNDLVLDRLRHVAQRRQYSLEQDRALSKRDMAQVNIASAQVEQQDAEIELATQMLSRAQLRAPFDAVVVSGDLSQSIGKPVSRGDLLYELAPLDRYHVVLVVPESDIGTIKAGNTGRLLLTALPERPIDITIASITPVARVSDGINGFEVIAKLNQSDDRIRPSMEGTAKIETVSARIIWIWTHSLVQWVRIKLWAWVP